jgi:hypothetical protein
MQHQIRDLRHELVEREAAVADLRSQVTHVSPMALPAPDDIEHYRVRAPPCRSFLSRAACTLPCRSLTRVDSACVRVRVRAQSQLQAASAALERERADMAAKKAAWRETIAQLKAQNSWLQSAAASRGVAVTLPSAAPSVTGVTPGGVGVSRGPGSGAGAAPPSASFSTSTSSSAATPGGTAAAAAWHTPAPVFPSATPSGAARAGPSMSGAAAAPPDDAIKYRGQWAGSGAKDSRPVATPSAVHERALLVRQLAEVVAAPSATTTPAPSATTTPGGAASARPAHAGGVFGASADASLSLGSGIGFGDAAALFGGRMLQPPRTAPPPPPPTTALQQLVYRT